MTSTHATSQNSVPTVRDTIRTNAGLFTAHGVILVLLGIAAVVWPQISSLAVDAVAGWLFLVGGLIGLVMMFYAADVAGFFWALLTAALELFVGVLLLWHPLEGVVTLTLVLIAFFITEGAFQIAGSIVYRSAFPEFVGLDAFQRRHRSRFGGPDHRRLAWQLYLGFGIDRRRQSDLVGHGDHHGGERHAKNRRCYSLTACWLRLRARQAPVAFRR